MSPTREKLEKLIKEAVGKIFNEQTSRHGEVINLYIDDSGLLLGVEFAKDEWFAWVDSQEEPDPPRDHVFGPFKSKEQAARYASHLANEQNKEGGTFKLVSGVPEWAVSLGEQKMTNRKELEEVIREAVSCVLEGCGDKEKELGESSQSGSTTKKTPEAYRLKDTSGSYGQKGKVPDYAKKYTSAKPGVRAGTKRQLNKKDRQAAKKELDEAIATAVRGVFESRGKGSITELLAQDGQSPPQEMISQWVNKEKLIYMQVVKMLMKMYGFDEVTARKEIMKAQAEGVIPGESELEKKPESRLIPSVGGTRQREDWEKLDEVAPPGREDQVKTLKKELPATYKDKETGETKESNPWAVAWSSFAKGKKEE